MKIELPFEMKNLNEDDGFYYFEGYANTKDRDLEGDVVEPGAFMSSVGKTVTMLWQHNQREPIGVFENLSIDDNGLFVKGKMPKDDVFVSTRVMPQIKVGSVKAMSVGFRIKNSERIEGGRLIKDLDLFEISVVTFPANPSAVISAWKSGELMKAKLTSEEIKSLGKSDLTTAIKNGLLDSDAAADIADRIFDDEEKKDEAVSLIKALHSTIVGGSNV